MNEYVRPTWIEYYMNIAKVVSTRSHDAETQHGCVIVNKFNQPLGFGYNGFPRNLKNDSQLPNTRPDKYPWMIHSEVNAVNNCIIKPKNAIAYVTGEPCNNCLMHLWQNNIVKVFYLDTHGTFLWGDEEKEIRKIFVEQSGIELIKVRLEESL